MLKAEINSDFFKVLYLTIPFSFALDLSSTEVASGYDRVYYPGEIEHITKQDRMKNGIFVEDTTVANINKFADESNMKGNLDPLLH